MSPGWQGCGGHQWTCCIYFSRGTICFPLNTHTSEWGQAGRAEHRDIIPAPSFPDQLADVSRVTTESWCRVLASGMGLSPGPSPSRNDELGFLSSQQVNHEALTLICASSWSADSPALGFGSDPSPVCRRQPPVQNTLQQCQQVCLPA